MHNIEYHNGLALLSGDGWITKWVKECGRLDHDHTIHKRLGDVLKQGMKVWDVGANVGTNTTFLQHCAGDSGMVVAFEPYLPAAYCCAYNVPKAVVVPCGLAEGGGIYPLSPNHANPGMTRITDDAPNYPVMLMGVRDALHMYGIPDFMKLDVEGFEPIVLGAYLQSVPPDKFCPIYVEFNKTTLSQNNTTVDALRKLLESFQYKIKLFDNDTWDSDQFDALAMPAR